jgi:urea transport system permease protein
MGESFMSIKSYCVALLCLCLQLFLNPALAETSASEAQLQVSAQTDPIQRFVQADFAERRAMLNQWPASIESLDQLVAYIDQNELYRDGAGQTYIKK